MASSKIRGITVEIGGDTTKLGKAIEDSDKKTKSLQGELKQVEKLLQMDPTNVELLAQKEELLTKAVAETENKVNKLREAQESVKKQFADGEIDEGQYRSFERELIKTEQELESLKTKASGAENTVEDLGDKAEDSGGGFTIMKGAIADLVGSAIEKAVGAIGNLVGSLLELSEATKEYRQMQGKLAGASDSFGYSLDFVNEKYKEFYGYVGDDQMATNAITNLMGIGTSTETVSKLAEGATAVWASYGDSIPIESLTESINETIQVGKITGTFADTVNWAKDANENLGKALGDNTEAKKAYNDALKDGLPVEDAFNEALTKVTDEQERADIVASFLNDTYGESKEKYDELSGSVTDANLAELELKDTQAELGDTLAPVNNAFTNLKNEALEMIIPLIETLADGFMSLYDWMSKHPVVLQLVTSLVIALATAFGIMAGALAIQGIINGVSMALGVLKGALMGISAVPIIAIITGIVLALIYLWNNCDAFREFITNIIPKIKALIEKAVNAVVKLFKTLPNKISNAISGAINKVKTWVNKIKSTSVNGIKSMIDGVVNRLKKIPSKVAGAISGALKVVSDWASNLARRARNGMGEVAEAIRSKLSEIPNKVKSIGGEIVAGVWSGISDKVGWIKDKLVGFKDQVIKALKSVFKIKSPSRVMRDEIGKYLAEGIALGLTDSDAPYDAVESVKDKMLNGATVERRLNNTFGSTYGVQNVRNNNTGILGKLDGIYEKLDHMQIVLDTGTLVGETIDKIDERLAYTQKLKTRGI